MPRTPLRSLAWPALHAGALGLLAASGLAVAAPSRAVVRQVESSFAPGALTVRAGTVVAFRNEDQLAHNVYSRTEGQAFNLGMARPGESVERTFDAPGLVEIRCAVHPRMRLALTVEP